MIRRRTDRKNAPRASRRPSADSRENPASSEVVDSGSRRGSPNTEYPNGEYQVPKRS